MPSYLNKQLLAYIYIYNVLNTVNKACCIMYGGANDGGNLGTQLKVNSIHTSGSGLL